ncbi:dienelactone hydrolase family protein [Salana multivorans]
MTQASAPDHVTVTIPVEGGDLPVRLYLPEGGRGPGLMLVQEIFGVSRYIADRARALAALGYVVAVPELYWRLGLAATTEEGSIEEVLGAGMAASAELGLDRAVDDVVTTLEWLPGCPEIADAGEPGGSNVGIIGFCFGGGVAFAATARLDRTDLPVALVSYYGSALPALTDQAERVRVPSLHHWGRADAFIAADVQESVREQLGRDGVEWFSYDGANHAFDNPHPAFHHADASRLAWERTTDFLRRHLPVS